MGRRCGQDFKNSGKTCRCLRKLLKQNHRPAKLRFPQQNFVFLFVFLKLAQKFGQIEIPPPEA